MKRSPLVRRTELRSSSSLLRGSGLNPTSARARVRKTQRGKATDIPATVRQAVHARSGGRCECGCGRRAQHVHHRRLRSQGGRHELTNLLDLSLLCHESVHANPERSYALGLLVHSWCDPADIPVTRTETAA